jgi:hypothetical protein
MAWLENVLSSLEGPEALPTAPSPTLQADHLVVCSHDVDFYFTDPRTALVRLFKNLFISFRVYRSWTYFRTNVDYFWRVLRGIPVGDYLPPLISRLEAEGIRSTFFVVPLRFHRRDPNYSLKNLAQRLRDALKRGFAVELHGSYCSMIENQELKPEASALQFVAGSRPQGNRQHWLRFDHAGKLFRLIERDGLQFDSSMGFSEIPGFRNGASFAFPPYDIENERPHNFLEIPLAIMDGSLVEASRLNGESSGNIARRILSESRKLGWGGISILWHNPVEELAVPADINQIFWTLAKDRHQFRERWISTSEFLGLCLQRYKDAGLLTHLDMDI